MHAIQCVASGGMFCHVSSVCQKRHYEKCCPPFLVTTKMYPFTIDCNRLSAPYSYVLGGIRMTRLSHVLCASVASYRVRMVAQSF